MLRGDDSSAETQIGAHVLVNTPKGQPRATLVLQDVELYHTGQAFRLGRYSVGGGWGARCGAWEGGMGLVS